MPEPADRPRQMVHTGYGKPAVTDFEVLERKDTVPVSPFIPAPEHPPASGACRPPARTALPHRRRRAYGRKAERLYLHAEMLEFTHPVTGKRISITQKADF